MMNQFKLCISPDAKDGFEMRHGMGKVILGAEAF